MDHFVLHSKYKPTGDQPQAIDALVKGFREGDQFATLKGVTGSGKTFTMANVIQKLNKPTLIISHNKTLAGQLYGEMKEFFPENAVEYFVSYYDYYQPEAYVPQSDTYIAKDSAINDEIDKLRLSATAALAERRDVVIVASVSCIYGIGSPEDYENMMVSFRPGMEIDRDDAIKSLIDMQYTRSDLDFSRGTFRVRGDVLDIFPAVASDYAYRLEFFGDEIDRILEIDVLTQEARHEMEHVAIFPASHYVVPQEKIDAACKTIQEELDSRIRYFKQNDKLLEAQRIAERTNFDIEMLRETGFCSGIENYSRHIDGRDAGSAPATLIDYFPEDFLLIIDESHVTVPQIGGMYEGDASRKRNLVDFGFRLPSALDNRPLTWQEFDDRRGQAVFMSATPGTFEMAASGGEFVEQVIRPTGLVDPKVVVKPTDGQIDDLIHEIRLRVEKKERVLVTTLTKKMAEDLTDYLLENGVRVRYLHSDIDTLQRVELLRQLRLGEYDVLVGINLLREGLDLPEVSLVAILDADKEGFLRSTTSLIQTIGRAARNVSGEVHMYADRITDSMQNAIEETERRREKQIAYNTEHGIDPQPLRKKIADILDEVYEDGGELPATEDASADAAVARDTADVSGMPREQVQKLIDDLTAQMGAAARELKFELAGRLRDEIADLRKELRGMKEAGL